IKTVRSTASKQSETGNCNFSATFASDIVVTLGPGTVSFFIPEGSFAFNFAPVPIGSNGAFSASLSTDQNNCHDNVTFTGNLLGPIPNITGINGTLTHNFTLCCVGGSVYIISGTTVP